MDSIPIVKMSAKGQLVVPESVREHEGFKPGDRFVPVGVPEGVLFKRIEMPDMKKELDRVAKNIRSHFRKNKITRKTVEEAVRWARRSSS